MENPNIFVNATVSVIDKRHGERAGMDALQLKALACRTPNVSLFT